METKREVPEVAELRAALERYQISAIDAAHYIGAGAKSVYNWLNGEHQPTAIWRGKIRAGLRAMDRHFTLPPQLQIYHYRRAVWPHLSFQEREAVLKIFSESRIEKYLAELKRLASEKKINVKLPTSSRAPEKKR